MQHSDRYILIEQRSYWRGISAFVVDLAALVCLDWLALRATSWSVQTLFASLAGVMIGVLFIVGHDAAHNSLTPHSGLNHWIGRVAFLPSLHSFSLWVLGHNKTHHRWTNLTLKDYVWTPLDRTGYMSLSRPQRLLYRFYRSAWGPLLYYGLENWWKHTFFPFRRNVGKLDRHYAFDTALVCMFACLYITTLVLGNHAGWWGAGRAWWNPVIFGAVLPFFIWNTTMGFVIYLHHTNPALVWYNDEAKWRELANQSELAVHVVFPAFVDRLFHWIMAHNAHHRRTGIPFYQLRRAQGELESNVSLRVSRFDWSPLAHLRIVRSCKLFDFQAQRWMDFEGNYTCSEPVKKAKFA